MAEQIPTLEDTFRLTNPALNAEATEEAVQTTDPVAVSPAPAPTPTPVREVDMVSTERGQKVIQQTDDRLQSIRTGIQEAQAEADRIQKLIDERAKAKPAVAEVTDSVTLVNPDTGQEQTLTGEAIQNQAALEQQGFRVSESSLSTTSSPEARALKTEMDTARKEVENFSNLIQAQAVGDSELRGIVNNIRRVYGARIQEMEDINERRQQSLNTLGIRLGSRFSGGSKGVFGSILSEEERQGQKRISDIEAEMLNAIDNAENAIRDFNLSLYQSEAARAEELFNERRTAYKDFLTAQEEQQQAIREEAARVEQEASVIEQVNLGTTDPFEIFSALSGSVPFDVIKEMVEGIDDTRTKPVTLGSFDVLVDPKTGEVIARGGKLGGVSGSGTGSVSVGVPTSGMMGGSLTITNADLNNMSVEERDFVTKVMRQLPTKLKDSEKEKTERQKEALFDFRRGRSIQEVVDEMNGFVVQEESSKPLADVFRTLAIGSGVDLSQISAAMNNNNPEQAMTTIENSKLATADQFFADPDEARTIVKLSDNILNLLNDPNFPADKLGAFDGRVFVVNRQLTPQEEVKVQNLQTALQTLNSPVRVSLIGTAGTEQEMAKITALQADIIDQPEIVRAKVSEFKNGVVDIHNQARRQRGLPEANESQIINNKARLNLYESMANAQFQGMSNTDLIGSMSSTGGDNIPGTGNFFKDNF